MRTAGFLVAIAILLKSSSGAVAADATPPSSGTATVSSDCNAPDVTNPIAVNSHAATSEDYPLLSVALGEEGKTIVALTVKEDGKTANVSIAKSSGYPRLDDATLEMVRTRWLYKPASLNGKPLSCPWQAAVVWKLQDNPGAAAIDAAFAVERMGPDQYTPDMLKRQLRGTIMLFVAVGADGKVTSSRLVGSTGDTELVSLSEKAATRLMFKPAQLQGAPVISYIGVAFVWSPSSPSHPSAQMPSSQTQPGQTANDLGRDCMRHDQQAERRVQMCTWAILSAAFHDSPLAYYARSVAYLDLHKNDLALADIKLAIAKAHKDDPALSEIYNNACFTRAVIGIELEEALNNCNESLTLEPNYPEALDSRGFVEYRMGDFSKSASDYTAALSKKPNLPSSLYMRGIDELRLGDAKSANADIATAKTLDSRIAETYAAYGVTH